MFRFCRLCAEKKTLKQLTTDVYQVKEMLFKILRWKKLDNETQLPQRVCDLCVESLNKCCNFIEGVKLADVKLNGMTKKQHFTRSSVSANIEAIYFEDEKVENEQDIKNDANDEQEDINEADNCINDEEFTDETPQPKSSDCRKEPNKRKRNQVHGNKFLESCPQEYRLSDGTISVEGVTKLEQNWPEMKTITWDQCKYKCDKCPKIIEGPIQFYEHFNAFHMDELKDYRFICYHCGDIQQDLINLNIHIGMKHILHLRYRCMQCPLYYWNLLELKNHRGQHSIQYKCLLCDKVGWRRNNLKVHIRNIHFLKNCPAKSDDICICEICKREFISKERIKVHMKTHMPARDFVCHLCGKATKMKASLQFHLASVHSTDRSFKCNECGKDFTTERNLSIHNETHQPSQNLPCHICGKLCHNKRLLRVHMKCHSDSSYACKHCDKKFRFRPNLIMHERVHTGIKPYACEHCDYACISWGNLNKHSKRIHSLDLSKKPRNDTKVK